MLKNNDIELTNTKTFCICGLPFQAISEENIIELIKKSSVSGNKLIINTPNLNFLRTASNDSNFYDALLYSDLLIPDGMPIIWIARLLQIPINKRIAGSSLLSKLISNLSDFPFKVFYFGGAPGVSRRARRVTNSVEGKSTSVGHLDPGYGDLDSLSKHEYIKKINTSKPNILLVSLPAKKGVSWISQNWNRLEVNIAISSGATVNFIAGTLKRSPALFQNIGLEWLWRILEEPRLLKRYFWDGSWLIKTTITKLIPLIFITSIFRIYKFRNVETIEIKEVKKDTIWIGLPKFCNYEIAEDLLKIFKNCPDVSSLSLDTSKVVYLDSRFLGEVLSIKSKFIKQNFAFKITNPSKQFRILSKLHGANNLNDAR